MCIEKAGWCCFLTVVIALGIFYYYIGACFLPGGTHSYSAIHSSVNIVVLGRQCVGVILYTDILMRMLHRHGCQCCCSRSPSVERHCFRLCPYPSFRLHLPWLRSTCGTQSLLVSHGQTLWPRETKSSSPSSEITKKKKTGTAAIACLSLCTL